MGILPGAGAGLVRGGELVRERLVGRGACFARFEVFGLVLEGVAYCFQLIGQLKAGNAARQPEAALRFGPQGLRQ